MGNQALEINPPAGAEFLTVNGSDWLWAVTAIFLAFLLAFFALSFSARAGEKIFHYLFTVAVFVGTIAYFAIASDLGFSVIAEVDSLDNDGPTRQIFFAKYIYWVVSFPTLTIALGLLSGISWATIVYQVFLAWIWVVSYLASAYTTSNYKWGFFAFGTVAWILLAHGTLLDGLRSARRADIVSRDYLMLTAWTNLLWLLYPIAFGLTDGGNRIGVVASVVFFGVLDLLAVPVVGLAFLFLGRSWDYGKLNIAFTQYGRVNAPGGTFPEKAPAPAAAAGAAPAGEEAV